VTKTRRKPSNKRSRRAAAARHLSPWARDAAGIGLVVLAILAALSLWFDAAGVVGHAIDYAARGALGS